ncbi:promotilin isoform X2 [Protopterus annectens]|nr:promotilin isoform X2 [Protopterus annectens]
MVSRTVIGCLIVVCVMAMLAEKTEGFISFFTPSDVRKMMEKERVKGLKKSTNLQQRSEGSTLLDMTEPQGVEKETIIKSQMSAPLEIGVRINADQLQRYKDVLGEVLQEILSENP